MNRQLFCDDSVGERRWVEADLRGRPIVLRYERQTDPNDYPHLGRSYRGRVVSLAHQFGGAFVDLGGEFSGFLPFRRGQAPKGLHEGQLIRVSVSAEPQNGKGPRLRRLPGAPLGEQGPEQSSQQPYSLSDAITGADARAMADLAEDEALSFAVAIPGGGDIAIEATRALTAIDVDAGDRQSSGDPGQSSLQINCAAVPEIARQISLRSIGGLVVIDFVSMRAESHKAKIQALLTSAFDDLGLRGEVARLSPNCLCECTIPRRARPVAEIVLDAGGHRTLETQALAALRRLEREALAQPGAKLALFVHPDVQAWLDACAFQWRTALVSRIGSRFEVRAELQIGPDSCEVTRT